MKIKLFRLRNQNQIQHTKWNLLYESKKKTNQINHFKTEANEIYKK
jgi:hypothetical protein